MSPLPWAQAPRSALLLAGFALAILPGQAGATAPQIAEIFQPSGGTTPVQRGATISDQTTVEVKVPTNCTFQAGQAITILQCEDADGKADDLPTDGSTCDGLTSNSGASLNVGTGGVVDKRGYEIYRLPSAALSEPPNASPVCSATSACVLYVGQNYNDFTQPHVWSAPFYVACPTSSTRTCGGGTSASTPLTTAAQPATVASNRSAVSAPGNVLSTAGIASSSSQLAATGPPAGIDWMVAGGVILLASGSLGRRRRPGVPR